MLTNTVQKHARHRARRVVATLAGVLVASSFLASAASAAPSFQVGVTHTPSSIARGEQLATYTATVKNGAAVTAGMVLTCGPGTWTGTPAPTFAYEWLRDGTVIGGESSATYQLAATDEGKSIQCRVTGANAGGSSSSAAAPAVVSPGPAGAPPAPTAPPAASARPTIAATPTATSGSTQTCTAPTGWSGAPTWTFQWLRNGAPASGPATQTTATTSTYVVQAGDLPGVIQCQVTGSNAGGAAIAVSLNKLTTSPAPTTPPTNTAVGSPALSGSAWTTGPVSLQVQVPNGMKLKALTGTGWTCSFVAGSCTRSDALAPGSAYPDVVATALIDADVAADTLLTTVTATGGGAAAAGVGQDTLTLDPAVPFGLTEFTTSVLDAAGNDYTQAGGHPMSASTTMSWASRDQATVPGGTAPIEDVREIETQLPPGFAGNPQAAGECPNLNELVGTSGVSGCPASSAVGFINPVLGGFHNQPSIVYNVHPDPGAPATFAFNVAASNFVVSAAVRSDGDYGITVSAAAPVDALTGLSLTFCSFGVVNVGTVFTPIYTCNLTPTTGAKPFLTNPTDCSAGPPVTRLRINSWQHPDVWHERTAYAATPPNEPSAVTGCDKLKFVPSISVGPDQDVGTKQADKPSAYTVALKVPQVNDPTDPATATDDQMDLATPPLKGARVTLPEGVDLSASTADGLGGCTDEQFGIDSLRHATCPDASKIGTLSIKTPLLGVRDDAGDVVGPDPLDGVIYLRQPDPGARREGLYAIFLSVDDAKTGIQVKLRGNVVPDAATGQLTATFDKNPQLPFSELLLKFKGGSRASLVNPETCGEKKTTTELSSWGGPSASPESTFAIDQGANGAPCAGSVGDLPFAPGFSAGVTDPQAGASSPFVLRFTRQDGEQTLSTIDASLPAGLVANIGAVPLCADDQAAAGTCDEASRVGSTVTGAGAGSSPLFIPQPGKAPTAVFLAGPYKGAPFSLSIVVPAQAGPFDLGTVVVRAAVFVDRHDAHVTVKSDPLPTMLEGTPLKIRDVRVAIDRPGFMLNPTSCEPAAVTGQISSSQGKTADVSAPFQTTGCTALPFRPQFAARTSADLKFKGGASFKVHVAVPAGDANIKSLATTLPKELPSRLIPTINNACEYATFQADYTSCPMDSFVGTVSAVTPILDQPLTGPVYIVAPPGDVPRLEIVLLGQGKAAGVRVDLEGDVIVNSGGGRSKVTFGMVPDVPVTSFDLDLPAGPHSILDAPSKDLCKGPITLGLSVVGQNGKRSDSNPRITVSDCPKIAKAKVVSAKTTATSVRLRVLAPAEGRLVVSGNGLKIVARTVNRKLTYSVTVPLSAAGKRAIARKGSLKTRPTVYFKPVNAKKASTVKTKTLTVKKAKAAAKKHSTKKTNR